MPLPNAKIRDLYEKHMKSCAEIAIVDGRSETTIYNALKVLGVQMRSRSKANQIFPDFLFITLYNLGLSSSQIGRLLGIHTSTVSKRLHHLRFPLRSRDVAIDIRYSENEFKHYFMNPKFLNTLWQIAGRMKLWQ